ncbi:MAG: hypothetical protein Q9187_007091 [Circinaria calcarea]
MAELQEIGAGIQITPNATNVLKAWDLLDAVKSCAVQPDAAILRSYRDGKVLSTQPLGAFMEETNAAPYLVIHRVDLHKILLAKAESLGIVIRLNSFISNISLVKPSLEIFNGEIYECDLILGADGEKSMCREALLGHADPLHDTGDEVFRFTIPRAEVAQHQDLAELVEFPNINFWVGPDGNVITYLVKKDNLLNFALTRARGSNGEVHYKPQKAEVSELSAAISQWDPRFKTLLSISQALSKWTLFEANEAPYWTHCDGHFALVGDAAHAMRPHLAQGAAQAFEDCAVLAVLFSKIQSKSQIPDILSIYERIRKPRAREVRIRAREMRTVFGMRDGPLQQERDRQLLEHAPFEGYPNPLADPVLQKWLYGYRAIEEAERAWEVYLKGEWPGTRGMWRQGSGA